MNKISIIIPAHNEEKFIEKTLEKVMRTLLPWDTEIIVVNDGSTDETINILEKLSRKYSFRLINHDKNLGKGWAIKTGIKNSSGNYLLIQDADLEYDPKNIPALLSKMDEDISAVYGKRSAKVWPKRGIHYVLGAKLLTFAINALYGSKLEDSYTGYKLFNLEKVSKQMLENLESSGFEFEAEVTCKILKNKGKILEVPITYIPRSREEGKHIGAKDALIGLLTICKWRF
jgi:dolichol-phosphate mannosyltransferase